MPVYLNCTIRATEFRNAYNLSTCHAICCETFRGIPTLVIGWAGDVQIELRKTSITDVFVTPPEAFDGLPDIVRRFVGECNR